MATPGSGRAWRRVKVYVAGATARGVPLAPATVDRWVDRIANTLAGLNGGGCTIHAPAEGWWRGRREKTVVVEALIDDVVWSHEGGRVAVELTLQQYLAATCQDTALFEAVWVPTGEVHFVAAHDSGGVVAVG